jgi:uncharacterized protein (DUF427 family)
MRATYNGTVIAESDATVVIEVNHYFPPDSVKSEFFRPTDLHTTCSWKGEASYYDVVVGDETASNAAWYYPAPKDAAAEIRDHVAFYPVVTIV